MIFTCRSVSLTLVGLAAKNAILIIGYAKIRVDERGMNVVDAAIEAAKFVYVNLMTSFAVHPWCIAIGGIYWCWFWCSYIHGYYCSSRDDHSYIVWYLIIPMLFIIIETLGPGLFTNRKKKSPLIILY